ncbi:MAG: Sel1 repeat, partial [Rhodocyclales bacterium]|nr:Sel1 repeat [Rhodocyclales bacterium]
AVEYVEKVIRLNVPAGYYQMGVFLEQGIGVKQDKKAALAYFRKAADMGSPQGQLSVGKNLLRIDDPSVRPRVLPIAESALKCALGQGLAEAGYELGIYYEITIKDIQKAMRAFQDGGKLGHNQSLFKLGKIFRQGEYGIEPDPQRSTCYAGLEAASDADKTKTFPDLDRICPLPPKKMPG